MMKKLMERVRMIRENQKKNGTKGFSMIELIIVIAIMAILIALIGTQLIPYLEKSRTNKDLNTLDSAMTALSSVIVDYEIDTATAFASGIELTNSNLETLAAGAGASFEKYAGYKADDAGKKFASGAAKGKKIKITAKKSGNATILRAEAGTLYVQSDGDKGNTADSSSGTQQGGTQQGDGE